MVTALPERQTYINFKLTDLINNYQYKITL